MRLDARPLRAGLLLAAVLLVALNLRSAIAAVAPVLGPITADLVLPAAAVALLTTLPVLCFGLAAPAASWLARRIGAERAVLAACLAIALSTALRPIGGAALLLAGTVVAGIGMTVGNVVVPVVIKRDFGSRAGTVTGFYTAALATGAALSAGLTAPLAAVWNWRCALAGWAALAVLAAAVWGVATRGGRSNQGGVGAAATPGPRLRSSGIAWAVTAFLGLQSFTYYSMTAWLPTLLGDDAGLDIAVAGGAMAAFQLIGIVGTLLVPAVAGRSSGQSRLGVSVACAWAVTVTGLLLFPAGWIAWVIVGGIAQGAGISYAFTVLVLRSADASVTRALSGMAQFFGYGFGALGPTVVGALYQATGGWTVPLTLLLALITCMAAAATLAGRPTTAGASPAPQAY